MKTCLLKKKGIMFIFSAPSGGGKSTIIKRLLDELEDVTLSVSVTTREKRDGEIEGKDYYFISEDAFRDLVNKNELYEYVDSDFGPKYGTPKAFVDELLNQGKDVILDLDYPGVQQLRGLAKDKVQAVFIMPPSLKVLKKRLIDRATDSIEVIEKRMSKAEKRINESVFYDYIVVNDDLDKAVAEAKAIILSARSARDNLSNLEEFISYVTEN